MPKPIVVILFPVALALASRAEDWPQWRGSGRDGVWHERGIRKTFPAEGLPVRWRAQVGYGFSSPALRPPPENWSGKGIWRRITRLRTQQPSAAHLWWTRTA